MRPSLLHFKHGPVAPVQPGRVAGKLAGPLRSHRRAGKEKALVGAFVVATGVVVGFVLGWLLGRRRSGESSPSARAPDDGIEILPALPDLIRRMLTSPSRRAVGLLALQLVDLTLRPRQSALFVARNTQRRLALVAGNGLPATVLAGVELDYGTGRVGYVAESRTAMDETDFQRAGLTGAASENPFLAGLESEVLAPLEDDSGLIGVLSVAGPSLRRERAKEILGLVADLTAVAISHVRRLRASEEAANVDGLTGTYNKQYFQKSLDVEVRRALRDGTPLSFLFLDIDHFKHYNDTNGHLAGDEVLKKVGELLKGSVREDDLVARYGGEEFLVLYRGATKELALRLAEGLRKAVESFAFPGRARHPMGAVTVSGGIATFPEDSDDGIEVIRQADQALYEAKAQGRNRIVVARSAA